ncbi:TetR family transcriptional regulator [Leminorella grimontii]|uniref:TetR family transcriptional regulator n=1 Tax=Leminorella grimontii TaxID=82981 RepID=A0AAV5N5G1_9GAMM|nr:TetR/AcrR family transcriptional regulator [Leminorella grimontii]KFC94606.1 TetR family transcriptional regulator [Leminorella grimontii ATCC 33999 = DSM 5078]GKX56703.1 TetR family transcriptional regulator [Leminorella grimontii]VFS61997.1 Bacterial regulatory proteins, tetR family [Leminorella grimontii]
MTKTTVTDKEPKPTQRYRDRKQTEAAILEAVSRLLARDGYNSLGINAISREAGVDKVLIYRYFGGLPEVLKAFGSSAGFWPSVDELFGEQDLQALPIDKRLQLFIDRVIDALRSRPLTLEILAMEIGAPNALTDILNTTRERWGQEIAYLLAAGYSGSVERLNIIMTVLFAGLQHLMIRARNTEVFSGIHIREDDGWQAIKRDLFWLCSRMAEGE